MAAHCPVGIALLRRYSAIILAFDEATPEGWCDGTRLRMYQRVLPPSFGGCPVAAQRLPMIYVLFPVASAVGWAD
jgi:hypothetical protein